LQALILFGCMGGFDHAAAPREVPLWTRAGVHAFAAMLTLVLRDAYRIAEGWSARRALNDIIAITVTVSLCQLFAMALIGAGVIAPHWIFSTDRAVVMALSILPALFIFRLGLGLDGDSRLQEPIGTLSVAELRRDFTRFQTRVRTRNLSEVGVWGLGALGAALYLLFNPDLGDKLIHWCWPLGQVVVSWYLLTHASARPMPELAPFPTLVSCYRTEIARQRRHVQMIWWWYLWPLCIGVGLPFFRRAMEGAAFIALGLLCVALVCGFVARFTAERARDFKEEMDVLSAVQERP